MKITVKIKSFFLIILMVNVMIMLMSATIFGGRELVDEVYQVFTKEFNKIRELKHRKPKA